MTRTKRRWLLAVLVVAGLACALVVWISQIMVAPPRPRIGSSARPVLGVHLREVPGEGVRILSAVSPARDAGLRAGDRIVALDDEPVETLEDVRATVRGAEAGQLLRVEARRPGPDGGEGGVLVDVPVVVRPVSPEDLDLPFEEVSFPDPVGLTVRGWYVPPPRDLAAPRAPGVVLGHGNASDRREWLEAAWEMHEAGLALLLIDFAGRGESDGEVITLGEREAGDLLASLEFLARRPEVDGSRLALVGRSMGAVAAILAAAEGAPVRALVLDSPFADLGRLVDETLASRFIPSWPFRPLAFRLAAWRADFDPAAIRPADAIAGVRAPIFILHGTADRDVPIDHAETLVEASGGRARLVRLEGLGHNDRRPPEVTRQIVDFLNSTLQPSD